MGRPVRRAFAYGVRERFFGRWRTWYRLNGVFTCIVWKGHGTS